MLQLHASSGADGFLILQDAPFPEQTRRLLANAARLLRTRGEARAADLLTSIGFRIVEATNHFNDDFCVLHAVVPLEHYERIRLRQGDVAEREAYRAIASTVTELGTFVRFIAVEMAMDEPTSQDRDTRALTALEIKRLVQKWIGVSGGYLADFSYNSHAEFYVDLGLSIDPFQYEGTTRERFTKILSESVPDVQARILEGVLTKYPVGSQIPQGSKADRSQQMFDEIRGWVARLRGSTPVVMPSLTITSEVVERALRDVEQLLEKSGPTSCVDRVHTALHGYMRDVCRAQALVVPEDASIQQLLKALREQHPAFRELGPRPEDVTTVLRALGAIVDKLNPLRNSASVAHPNPALLPTAEAMLVVNAVRTILHYLEMKLHPRGGDK